MVEQRQSPTNLQGAHACGVAARSGYADPSKHFVARGGEAMPMNGERQPKREPHDRTAMLRAHPFFKGLTPSIVDELAPRAVTRSLRRGAVLFRKGDQGSSFYLLISGAVRIDAPS